MRIRKHSERSLPWRIIETRLPSRDHALVERFIAAWRSLHPGDRSAALRALLRLGLDAAARPQNYDDRWLDVSERLARAEALLDALGVAVSALPALVTFLHAHAASALDEHARGVLAERLELLFEADWDQRCRSRGIPRPRFTKLPRRAPLGGTQPVRDPARRSWKTTVRLSPEMRERIVAAALRDETTSQAALRRALDVGLCRLEAAAHHDELERLAGAVKRIEIQLDEIGALATGGPAVAVHLWRRAHRLSDEDEATLLAEVYDVALATWAQLLAGPPQPPLPDDDPDDDSKADPSPDKNGAR